MGCSNHHCHECIRVLLPLRVSEPPVLQLHLMPFPFHSPRFFSSVFPQIKSYPINITPPFPDLFLPVVAVSAVNIPSGVPPGYPVPIQIRSKITTGNIIPTHTRIKIRKPTLLQFIPRNRTETITHHHQAHHQDSMRCRAHTINTHKQGMSSLLLHLGRLHSISSWERLESISRRQIAHPQRICRGRVKLSPYCGTHWVQVLNSEAMDKQAERSCGLGL